MFRMHISLQADMLKRKVGMDGRHRYQSQQVDGSVQRGCLEETTIRVVPRKVLVSFRLLQAFIVVESEAFIYIFS